MTIKEKIEETAKELWSDTEHGVTGSYDFTVNFYDALKKFHNHMENIKP